MMSYNLDPGTFKMENDKFKLCSVRCQCNVPTSIPKRIKFSTMRPIIPWTNHPASQCGALSTSTCTCRAPYHACVDTCKQQKWLLLGSKNAFATVMVWQECKQSNNQFARVFALALETPGAKSTCLISPTTSFGGKKNMYGHNSTTKPISGNLRMEE